MNISASLIKDLGYKRVSAIFGEVNFNIIYPDYMTLDTEGKTSAFSVASNWGTTFGIHELKICSNFVAWYKSYYPFIGLDNDIISQNRLYRAHKKLTKDFMQATGVNIQEYSNILPMIELDSLAKKFELGSEIVILLQYINTVYGWSLLCSKEADITNREYFEWLISLLSLKDSEFISLIDKGVGMSEYK